MRVLILQQPSSTAAVDRWLAEAEPGLELTVVTGSGAGRGPGDYAPGTRTVEVGEYFGPAADRAVLDLATDWSPDRVVSNAELDVLRAGTVRSLLGIPGTGSGLAVRFRDKLRMKELFRAAGLAAPRARAVRCLDDVATALDAWGPVVLKPRDGAGSQGVRVLSGLPDLHRLLLQEGTPATLHGGGLVVEEFVTGEVFHVDAVLDEGDVLLCVPSRYVHAPHTFGTHDTASAFVDEGSAEHTALVRLTRDFVAALPSGHGVSIIHLEVYRTTDGEFLAGEVAARLGGGMVKQTIAHAYGVDLSREGYLLSAGLRRASRLAGGPSPSRSSAAGWRLFTASRPAVPAQDVPGHVHGFWRREAVRLNATSSVDAAGGFIATGRNHDEVVERMSRVR